MEQKLQISISPHIRGPVTTAGIMLDVILSLCPAAIAAVVIFGARALLLLGVCVLTCVLSELCFALITRRTPAVGDLSAVVTGMLLSFSLPVNIPLWQAMVGSAVAIVVVKQMFGGIGCNFANPAVTARIVLFLSFSGTLTKWVEPGTDIVSAATPLVEGTTPLYDLFLGKHPGSMGETCALALLIGGVYLLVRRVITWHTPAAFAGTVFLMGFFAGGFDWHIGMYHLLSGGLLLGAIFMATDYATTPPTAAGKLVFGLGCGLITGAIRLWGAYPEGISFAILFMNLLTPYITKLCAHRPFGAIRRKRKEANA